jgi:hypothetical protein
LRGFEFIGAGMPFLIADALLYGQPIAVLTSLGLRETGARSEVKGPRAEAESPKPESRLKVSASV